MLMYLVPYSTYISMQINDSEHRLILIFALLILLILLISVLYFHQKKVESEWKEIKERNRFK